VKYGDEQNIRPAQSPHKGFMQERRGVGGVSTTRGKTLILLPGKHVERPLKTNGRKK